MIDDLHHLCRGDPGNDPQDLFSRRLNIDDHPGDLQGGNRHGFLRPVHTDGIVRNELIQEIEIRTLLPIQLGDHTVLDGDGRFRIIGAAHRNKSHLRPFIDKPVFVDSSLIQSFYTF